MSKIENAAGTWIDTCVIAGHIAITITKTGESDNDIKVASIALTPAQAREQAAIIKAHASQAEEAKK